MTIPSEVSFVIPDPKDKAPASSADKPRRGRPPGSKNSKPSAPRGAASEAANLRQALSTMESLYEMTSAGLLLFGLEGTAQLWAGQAETLKATNEKALAASPKLAASIANVGSVGGAASFFSAHIMAIAPVMLAARMEIAAKRQANVTPAEDYQPDNVTRIPGA